MKKLIGHIMLIIPILIGILLGVATLVYHEAAKAKVPIG